MYAVLICWVVRNGVLFSFFKQKTAYEVRISDWSSDVCSSDLSPRSERRASLRRPRRRRRRDRTGEDGKGAPQRQGERRAAGQRLQGPARATGCQSAAARVRPAIPARGASAGLTQVQV